ncbi:hypothetical protein KY362_02495 [Candidatus Woesearchaeota archaeon]|nr:hypothetical protein [Candidatus Woesearchaeota archaeon]
MGLDDPVLERLPSLDYTRGGMVKAVELAELQVGSEGRMVTYVAGVTELGGRICLVHSNKLYQGRLSLISGVEPIDKFTDYRTIEEIE